MLRVLDIFSGIGGFSLGLERTSGFQTVAFCEIEPFPRRVLTKHWPGVPIYEDVRTLTAQRLAADGLFRIDVICGGFPCQDLSIGGKGKGLSGERSGLWFEYLRLVAELRPKWVIIENVAALRSRGLDTVLRGVAEVGYDAEWHCIPASAIGAPHERDRVWVVAYLADTNDSYGDGRRGDVQMGWLPISQEIERASDAARVQWGSEPGISRVAYGVPNRLDRLRSVGNALVPQIPEAIGNAILKAGNRMMMHEHG
jgi:DNA (cytosine-5)-methyltransferase 1